MRWCCSERVFLRAVNYAHKSYRQETDVWPKVGFTATAEERLFRRKQDNMEKRLCGIHGWLALFVFAMFVNGLVIIGESLNVPAGTSIIFCALVAGLGLVAIAAGVQLVRKKKQGLLLAKVFLVGNIVLNGLAVIGSLGDDVTTRVASVVSFGRVLLFSALWLLYLKRSVRIRNTFFDNSNQPVTVEVLP